jgi:hypothetical protein
MAKKPEEVVGGRLLNPPATPTNWAPGWRSKTKSLLSPGWTKTLSALTKPFKAGAPLPSGLWGGQSAKEESPAWVCRVASKPPESLNW